MRLAQLSTWRPAPGRIVVWRPREPVAASPLPGPASFLQADHLDAYRRTTAAGRTHRAWTGTATDLEGDLDVAAMGRALGAFVDRHEGLRTYFELDAGSPQRMAVAPGVEFEAVDVSGPDDWASDWEATLVALYDQACRPDSWPGFVLGGIVRGGSFSLFWGADHAFTDGASQLMAPVELSLLYDGMVTGKAPQLPAAAGFPAYAAEERSRAASYGPDAPEVEAWRGVIRRHDGRLPRFPLDLGLAAGETAPVTILRADVLRGADIDLFERVCREAGGRFTSGVYAALALAERALVGEERYYGVTVLGTRTAETATSHGWFCNFAPVEFAVGETFPDTVVAAEEAMGMAKAVSTMPVHAALGAMLADGTTTPEQLGSPQLVSYLDLRRMPGADLPAYRNAVHFTGEGRTANCSLWINRDDDALYICVQAPDNGTGPAAARRYLDAAADSFAKALVG